ncbi:preprotein translocase subunit Sec61beta [Candidatus Woesearchaeota archaeon]|nr:preprotein translocase subunit Sec61beta [Candidatus Woesearchaeota archaeon]
MARDDKVQMPSSMGGLVRYFDEYKSKIEIKPGHVVLLSGLVMVIEILLHTFGKLK